MIIKAVTFFLIGMVVLAMFGKLRYPGQKKLQTAKCPRCGRYKIGKTKCNCDRG